MLGAPGSRAPPGLSSTEVQGAAEGAGPGASGAPLPAAAAPQFALLVMRPCGGPGEPAALGGGAGAAGAPGCLCEGAAAGGEEAAEDEADLLDAADGPGGGESAASLEDPEDEGLLSGGEGGPGAARRRGGGGGCVSKTCTYEGCRETTSQVAKQRKPWMCKKHRNKMYKDKYKKKKSDQAQSCGGAAPAGGAGNVKLEVPGLGRGCGGGSGRRPPDGPGRRGRPGGQKGGECSPRVSLCERAQSPGTCVPSS